ncbi:MAG: hypothetical protein ACOVOE_03415, partial [Caulobacter sp.]
MQVRNDSGDSKAGSDAVIVWFRKD